MSQEQFYLLAAKMLSQEASTEEQAAFNQLVGSSTAWQEEYRNVEEIWKSTHNQSVSIVETEDAYLMHLARLKDSVQDFQDHGQEYQPASDEDFRLYPTRQPWFRRWTTIAASAAMLGLGLFAFSRLTHQDVKPAVANAVDQNEITVKKGAKTKLQLPDGSQVWVNSDSKLTYPEAFNGAKREVYLEGEAYFDIVKDPSHPFIVHTSGINVRVLGTAFNVKAYKAEPTIEATLVHGVIEVTKTNEPNAPKVILKHHEKLIYNKLAETANLQASNPSHPETNSHKNRQNPAITIAHIASQTPDSAFLETAWVYNRLRFEEERFDELVVKMERWFDVSISIENEKIKALKLTGSFENETIREALQELQYLVPFNYRINDRNIIITKR